MSDNVSNSLNKSEIESLIETKLKAQLEAQNHPFSGIFKSKKFWAAIIASVGALAGKFGLNISQTELATIVSPVIPAKI